MKKTDSWIVAHCRLSALLERGEKAKGRAKLRLRSGQDGEDRSKTRKIEIQNEAQMNQDGAKMKPR